MNQLERDVLEAIEKLEQAIAMMEHRPVPKAYPNYPKALERVEFWACCEFDLEGMLATVKAQLERAEQHV